MLTTTDSSQFSGSTPDAAADARRLHVELVAQRLSLRRATRRQPGAFDFTYMSWDWWTTRNRAARIVARMSGVRNPLMCVVNHEPVLWNAYHD